MRTGYGSAVRSWTILAIASVSLGAIPSAATEWPGYLGPNRDGVLSGEGLIAPWPDGGLAADWSIEVGPGFGGAAVVDSRVFVLDRVGDEGDALRVLDLDTGRELWRYQYDAPGRLSWEGSRSTPAVTDEFVFTVGGFGDLTCISRRTHQPVWSVNLEQRFGVARPSWGYAQSPLVVDDMVIVSPVSGESPALVAFDMRTGEVRWESQPAEQRGGSDYYASPVLREILGRRGVLQITNHQVSFVDPADGSMIWRYNGYTNRYPIPFPTVVPGDTPDRVGLFITGGYDAGSVFIDIERSGDDYTINERWRWPGDGVGCQIHPAIHHDGYLYANINENTTLGTRRNRARGGLACIDPADGRIVWHTGDSPSFDRGGLLLVGDNLVAMEGQTGELYLVRATPDGYRPISTIAALPQAGRRGDASIWGPLAIGDGRLIVRDQQVMKCFDLRAPAQ